MSIKFYSQTLWTTLIVSLLVKKLGEAPSLFAMQARRRPGPRSKTQRPRPAPNKRQSTDSLFFCSINRKTLLHNTVLTSP